MLYKAETLSVYSLHSRDGEIGKVKEFYFDDHYWTIRYLVAETGTWLTGRQVLISPYALGAVSKQEQRIAIDLTTKQIEDSPSLNSDKPVSRQYEDAYHGYYGYPRSWYGSYTWGMYPYILRNSDLWKAPSTQDEKTWDPHLRSTRDVRGHHIQATDGVVGHVDDVIIDDETWAIRYLVIDTRNFWPGRYVLISPRWIERVSWDERKVFVNVLRKAIKQSPEYAEEALLTRDYETRLHGHYNRQGYWIDEPTPEAHSR